MRQRALLKTQEVRIDRAEGCPVKSNYQNERYHRPIVGMPWACLGVVGWLAYLTAWGDYACAQKAPVPCPLPTSTNRSSDILTPQPGPDFTGCRLGPFDIQSRIATAVTYDDNILIASQNPEADLIWSLQPALLAVAGDRTAIEDFQRTYHNVVRFSPDTFIITPQSDWPGKALMLDYGPRFNWFTTHTENDSIDQFLNFNALWPVSKIILGVRQEYVQQNATIIEAGRRTWQQTVPTALMSGYQFSEKTSVEVNLSRTAVSYEQQQGLADYTDWNWANWLNYQYSACFNLGWGANFGALELPSQPGQVYEALMVRARYLYGTRIILDGAFGLQLRQYEGGVPNTMAPVFNLVARYAASESTVFHVTAFRRESPSVSSGYDYLSTGAAVGFQQRLGDRYFARLDLTCYTIDYLATSPALIATEKAHQTDTYFEVRPAYEVQFSHHLFGSVFYLFRTLKADQGAGWTDNQIGTRLTWTF